MAPTTKLRRHVRLVRPGLQLRLILTFVGLSALALLLQYILFMSTMSKVALGLPNDGLLFLGQINGILVGVFLASFGILLPLTFAIGVIMTHKFAGPLYRFEAFMNATVRGERPADCKLRKGDELEDFAELLNQVTAPMRQAEAEPAGAEPAGAEPAGAEPAGAETAGTNKAA
jgi:hypothetical protein